MKIKTFKAATMPLALAMVKKEMGVNAVILHTRSFRTGGVFGLGKKSMVEITARPGKPAERRKTQTASQHTGAHANRLRRAYGDGMLALGNQGRNEWAAPRKEASSVDRPAIKNGPDLDLSKLYTHDEQMRGEINQLKQLVENLVREQRQLHAPQMPEQLFDIYLELIQREVADEIARDLISRVQQDVTGNQSLSADLVRERLVREMDRMINTTGPISSNTNGDARVVALIGPTGVGKTTTIAKIAANLKLRQNKKVGLITIDTYRIGAVDQLRMYAQIIDVPIKVVLTPVELKEAIDAMRDMDVILIDTAGRSQNDQLKLTELKTFLDAARADEVHLVLSGTAHHSHMLSAAERFKTLGVDRIILTKLDEAISFGVVLSVVQKVNASISYVTTGQDVPDDIEIGNGRRLAQMLLGLEDSVDGSRVKQRSFSTSA